MVFVYWINMMVDQIYTENYPNNFKKIIIFGESTRNMFHYINVIYVFVILLGAGFTGT